MLETEDLQGETADF